MPQPYKGLWHVRSLLDNTLLFEFDLTVAWIQLGKSIL